MIFKPPADNFYVFKDCIQLNKRIVFLTIHKTWNGFLHYYSPLFILFKNLIAQKYPKAILITAKP